MRRVFLTAFGAVILTFGLSSYVLAKEVPPKALKRIEEYCKRAQDLRHVDYAVELKRQKQAYLSLNEYVEAGLKDSEMERLRWALLRWSWVYGADPMGGESVVDWEMALFEFRRHTGKL